MRSRIGEKPDRREAGQARIRTDEKPDRRMKKDKPGYGPHRAAPTPPTKHAAEKTKKQKNGQAGAPGPSKEKSPDLHPDPFPKEHLFQSRILPWLELRTLRILTSSPVLAST